MESMRSKDGSLNEYTLVAPRNKSSRNLIAVDNMTYFQPCCALHLRLQSSNTTLGRRRRGILRLPLLPRLVQLFGYSRRMAIGACNKCHLLCCDCRTQTSLPSLSAIPSIRRMFRKGFIQQISRHLRNYPKSTLNTVGRIVIEPADQCCIVCGKYVPLGCVE